MTGPRKRAMAARPLVDQWHPATVTPTPSRALELVPIAKRPGRPRDADADSRMPRPAADGLLEFAMVPAEVWRDRRLEPIDTLVFAWIVSQRELHRDGELAFNVRDVDVPRDERQIREALKRLRSAKWVTVDARNGTGSVYRVPWLNVHKLARRMVADEL